MSLEGLENFRRFWFQRFPEILAILQAKDAGPLDRQAVERQRRRGGD